MGKIDPKALIDAYKMVKEKPYLLVDFPSEKHQRFVQFNKNFKALIGGNRSGKTETMAIEVLWHLLGEHPFYEVPKPPVRWRIHVPTYTQLEIVVLEKFRKYVPEHLLKGGSWDSAAKNRNHIIYFANGSVVDITTHRAAIKRLEGTSLDGVWIDEECDLNQYRALTYRVIDRKGKVFVSATPILGVSWLYDEFIKPYEAGNPHYLVEYFSTYENKYLDPDAIRMIEETASPEERDIRLHGKIQNVSRRVFNRFNPEEHVQSFPFPSGAVWYVGLDWGYFHKTAVVFLAQYADVFLVVDEYVAQKLPLDRVGVIIENWCEEHGINPRTVRVVYDAAMNRPLPNGKREIDLLRTQFPFRVVPSAKNIPLTIATTNDLFAQNRLLIHPQCKYLIEDLQKLYMKNNKIASEDPAKDTCDALRYVVFYAATLGQYDYDEDEEDETYIPSAQERLTKAILERRYPVRRKLY